MSSNDLAIGRFVLSPAARALLDGGEPVKLGARAFDLLLALAERRDRVVGKNELLDVVWAGRIVEENNLQVQVATLRKLLGPDTITTIPGRGYRLTAGTPGAEPEQGVPAAAGNDPAGNLAPFAPALIGRETALRELLAAIDGHALVSVTGAGGIGKTALAAAAAVALRGRQRDGAWWVELAPLAEARSLVQAVAQALRIALAGAGDTQRRLVGALGSQEMLLVLDNCEHLIDAVGALAAAIVAGAPGVRVLVTSQERLNIPGEHVFRLEPLALPAAGEPPQLQRHGAVALFAERAQAADSRFALGADNAEAVAEICRRLDGLPLAIELAAARVPLLGVHGVSDRIGERFKLLTGGARTALRRHQTMRATIEWSHALLGADEQAVLRRLGVFVGGFPLALAQAVCADDGHDEWAVLDAIGALVDKSLVTVDAGEPVRYRLLETTRAYALERLADAGETPRMLQRHAHAVRELFVRTDDERFGDGGTLDMTTLMRRLVPEIDNWRAAFDWVVGDGAEPATAIALAGAGALVLDGSGLCQEALDRLLPLRAAAADAPDIRRAAVFWQRMTQLGTSGRLPRDALLDATERMQRLSCQVGSQRLSYLASCHAAWALNMVGESAAAEASLSETVGSERADDPHWLRCLRLNVRAAIHHHQGRFEEAASVLAEEEALLLTTPGERSALGACRDNLCVMLNCLERHAEAITLARSVTADPDGDGASSYLLAQLLHAQTALGRIDDGWSTLREALPVWRRDALLVFAGLTVAEFFAIVGRHADAARLEAAATAHVRRSGISWQRVPQQARERVSRSLDAAGAAAADLERWRREGEAFDEAQVAALCAAAQPR